MGILERIQCKDKIKDRSTSPVISHSAQEVPAQKLDNVCRKARHALQLLKVGWWHTASQQHQENMRVPWSLGSLFPGGQMPHNSAGGTATHLK